MFLPNITLYTFYTWPTHKEQFKNDKVRYMRGPNFNTNIHTLQKRSIATKYFIAINSKFL